MPENAARITVDRTGLISVPLLTRPKADEIRPYLRAFQAYIMEQALSLVDKRGPNPNSMIDTDVSPQLRRLVTSLSTELEFVRLPIVWTQYKRLLEMEHIVKEQALEEDYIIFKGLVDATGIFLSHFDIVRHLSEAERRVSEGDDKIDEALFVEIDELVREFDKTRAEIFANEIERSDRIKAVLALPSGYIPKYTVLVYKLTDHLARFFSLFVKKAFPVLGAVLIMGIIANSPIVEAFLRGLSTTAGSP